MMTLLLLLGMLQVSGSPIQTPGQEAGAAAAQVSRTAVDDAPKPADSLDFMMEPKDPAQKPWRIHVGPDGSGIFQRLGVATPTAITVSPATRQKLNAAEAVVASGHCQTKLKHVASTGKKTIAFQAGGGPSPGVAAAGGPSCTFEYSDSATLMEAAEAFQGIVETLEAGERLEHDHRFDRLGLDAEMSVLANAVKDGLAIEVQNIAATLKAIADDERVLDRVRRGAARLLVTGGNGSA